MLNFFVSLGHTLLYRVGGSQAARASQSGRARGAGLFGGLKLALPLVLLGISLYLAGSANASFTHPHAHQTPLGQSHAAATESATPRETSTDDATSSASDSPTAVSTEIPTDPPTAAPTATPEPPTDTPTVDVPPTDVPSDTPTVESTVAPSPAPTAVPTDVPPATATEASNPTEIPTDVPTEPPTEIPTDAPTSIDIVTPTLTLAAPSDTPPVPTATLTVELTETPTLEPTGTETPTLEITPTESPEPGGTATAEPTVSATSSPTSPADVGIVRGQIQVQGEQDAGGVVLESDSGETTTLEHGTFTFSVASGAHTLTASKHGYLPAKSAPVTIVSNETAHMPTLTLIGGDANGDGMIDIADAALVASEFGKAHTNADLNGDGVVNVLDLVLVSSNFGRGGVQPW